MDLNKFRHLIEKFRIAIDTAKSRDEFEKDISFNNFPRACCGDTSELLACYLKSFGYDTIYVCGVFGDQSHAWLVLNDKRVSQPAQRFYDAPEEIRDVLNLYSNGQYNEPINVTRFEAENVENGLVIDITADQFAEMKNMPVYIGYMDDFHRKFEFDFAREYDGLKDYRLVQLYRKICEYL